MDKSRDVKVKRMPAHTIYRTRIPVRFFYPIIIGLVCFVFFLQDVRASDFQAKFEETCSQTQEAESLSVEELESLLDKTDKLLSQIQSSDDPSKKVYIFRLEKCISFYKYVLDTKRSQ